MKKEIILNPKKASLNLFLKLEKQKLIRLIRPARSTIETKTRTGAISRFYTSSANSGTHTLISVGKRTEKILLSWHDDNEDFFLINPLNLKFKPLYLILSHLKKNDFLKKLDSGLLTAKDLMAVELEFNNPQLSFFIMLKNTVHCEITDSTEKQHPVFFVSEAARLKDNKIKIKKYNIRLTENK